MCNISDRFCALVDNYDCNPILTVGEPRGLQLLDLTYLDAPKR